MTLLRGKIFVSTVSLHKTELLKSLFEPLGAVLEDFPMTEILPVGVTGDLRQTLESLDSFRWVIFTSANGVAYFFKYLHELQIDIENLVSLKMAVVGIKTATALENFGRKADFVGSGNTAEEMLAELLRNEEVRYSSLLLALGNLAPDVLENRLAAYSKIKRINVYETVRAVNTNLSVMEKIKNNEYDLVLFTSPSGVEHFTDIIKNTIPIHQVRAASIGVVTTNALSAQGIPCLVTAKKSTYEGLCEEIVNYYQINN